MTVKGFIPLLLIGNVSFRIRHTLAITLDYYWDEPERPHTYVKCSERVCINIKVHHVQTYTRAILTHAAESSHKLKI